MLDLFSDDYALCTRPPAGEVAEGFPDPKTSRMPPEAALQTWWASLTPGTRFETLEGHRLEVVHPGIRNRSPGPDFTHAHLAFNGEVVRGCVEIHRTAQAWTRHGHHADPRYRDVILHVTAAPDVSAGTSARTSSGRWVATLRIPPECVDPVQPDTPDTAPLPTRCRDKGSPDAADLQGLLWLAASWRVLQKARALAERAAAAGLEQAVYERIMTACGWGGNEPLMEALARAVPCERLRQMARQHERLPEAALLHMAGILPDAPPATDDSAVPAYWAELHALRVGFLPGLRRLKNAPFPIRGRPQNRPERRLAAAARIIARTAIHGVADTLLKPWYAFDAKDPELVAGRLMALFEVRHGFWESRCSWTGRPLPRPTALIGPDRALSMAGNIALPLALIHARERGSVSLEQRIGACLRVFPAEPDSAPLRWMRLRLFGGRYPFRAGFAHQQGLLQIYRDWCGHNLTCADCPIPRALNALTDTSPAPDQSR